MTAKYTLTAYCPFGLGEIEVDIVYTYSRGRPARGPSYASGGEPAEPAALECQQAEIDLYDWIDEEL